MTIKQQGGVFGRNPTFNSVDTEAASDFSANGETPLTLNRLTSDGQVLAFDRDGAEVGDVATTGTATNLMLRSSKNSSQIEFHAKNSSGAYQSIRWDTATSTNGSLRPNTDAVANLGLSNRQWNNLYLAGNVIVASGSGIDFSATSGTGTSELFDDYEEGTWTPEITSGATGVTYSTQVGHYTKVGNLVTFSGRITTTAATADANQFRIGGLPFTAANLTFGGAYMTYANSNFQASTTANNPTLAVAQNQSRMDFYATNGAPIAGTSFPNLAAAIVWFAGHFYTV